MIRANRLPENRWKDYKKIRLEALRAEPAAFGSSYEEELELSEEEWRKRMKNVLFAVEARVPVGMMSYVFNTRLKTSHIASIYGVYVTPKYRGRGIGGKLMDAVMEEIKGKGGIIKVQLSVNPGCRPAVRLYKRVGFIVTGRARKELKIGNRFYDLLYMEKML